MNKEQIAFIRSLDKDNMNGTIQSLLHQKNIEEVQFTEALKFLLVNTLREKETLAKENRSMVKFLKGKGLYSMEVYEL
jgi:hypothetical protein